MDSTVNSQSNTVAPKQAECKKMRYSIRKVAAVGATSALVGTLAFLGATQVKADQVTETAPAVATATATPETSTASLTVASELQKQLNLQLHIQRLQLHQLQRHNQATQLHQ